MNELNNKLTKNCSSKTKGICSKNTFKWKMYKMLNRVKLYKKNDYYWSIPDWSNRMY
jgi:hypothetical protein